MTTPFDFINSITYSKENLLESGATVKEYNAFMINKGLSQHQDTIMYANEMNQFYDLPEEWQYQFLINSIAKRKRFGKWAKKDDSDLRSFQLVKEYYNYSNEKAKQVLGIFTNDVLDEIEQKLNKGGK